MTSEQQPRCRNKKGEQGGEAGGGAGGRECLLFGAFADDENDDDEDGVVHGRLVSTPHASLAPLLLFGGALPPLPRRDGAQQRPLPPVPVAAAAAAVSADGFALVAADGQDGGLWQCQYGDDRPVWSRVEVEGLPRGEGERFSAVAVGDFECLALACDGSAFQWRRRRRRTKTGGGGEEGDGDGDDDEDNEAKCVLGPRLADEQGVRPLHRLPVVCIAAGRRHFLAAAASSCAAAAGAAAAAFAWGDTSRGQCAVAPGCAGSGPSGSFLPRPRVIEALGGVPCALCAAGDHHSLFASRDGASVFSFGGGAATGAAAAAAAPTPTLVSEANLPLGDAPVLALAAGGKHSVALDGDGRAFCWGDGSWGQRWVEKGGGGVGGGGGDARDRQRRRAVGVVAGWRHSVLVLE